MRPPELEELRDGLNECLNSLKPIDRRIIESTYFEWKNDIDIALELGVTPSAVRVRRFRALRHLRSHFPDLWRRHRDGDDDQPENRSEQREAICQLKETMP